MESDFRTRAWLHFASLIAVTAFVILACYWMVRPFLSSITTAVALAVLMIPVQRWLESRAVRPSIAAAITVLGASILVIAPILLIGERLVSEITYAATNIENFFSNGDWEKFRADNPPIQRMLRWVENNTDVAQVASTFTGSISGFVTGFVQASGAQIVALVISFYMLFFVLRDRRSAVSFINQYAPIDRLELTDLAGRVARTIRMTVLGTILISLIQGALGGLMFWWLGLPSPVIWAVVMGLAAMVPVLGTFLVWIPAAILLFATGQTLSAFILVLWGVVVVGGIDNLLYPLLVGSRLKSHTMVTFVSLVGGVIVFGPAGLILGPVIFTIANFLLDHWRQQEPEILPLPESEDVGS